MSWCHSHFFRKHCICGPEPEEPIIHDKGRCFPYRTRITCDAPTIPGTECNDTSAHAIPFPGQNPPFKISATLFDQNCLPITDQNDIPITTIFY